MAKTTLNKANLKKLGTEHLADLILELVQGSLALQRRVRMELSAASGPKDVASDIRKRFVSLRRSTSFVDWRKQRALVKDLEGLLHMIEKSIAPSDANEAFELLWSFLLLAPSIQERTDDSNGSVGDVFRETIELISRISPNVSMDGKLLAERILEAVVDAGYGEFDSIIPATAEILGHDGLEHLKAITREWAGKPPTEDELEKYRRYGWSSSPEEFVQRNKQTTSSVILADIADAQGDVDAYIARYTKEQLTFGTIAPDVARRLLDANRIDEAFEIICNARASEKQRPFWGNESRLDDVYEECLEKLGKTGELKQHLINLFEDTLSERSLQKYIKMLPDFEDIETEEWALSYAETYSSLTTAICFLVEWPDHERAAKTILARAEELNGDNYYRLTEVGDVLEEKHPLAATMARRAMITDTLDGKKSKRYKYAARHLAECAACTPSISDYKGFPSQQEFISALRETHGRKYGFWGLVDGK